MGTLKISCKLFSATKICVRFFLLEAISKKKKTLSIFCGSKLIFINSKTQHLSKFSPFALFAVYPICFPFYYSLYITFFLFWWSDINGEVTHMGFGTLDNRSRKDGQCWNIGKPFYYLGLRPFWSVLVFDFYLYKVIKVGFLKFNSGYNDYSLEFFILKFGIW